MPNTSTPRGGKGVLFFWASYTQRFPHRFIKDGEDLLKSIIEYGSDSAKSVKHSS